MAVAVQNEPLSKTPPTESVVVAETMPPPSAKLATVPESNGPVIPVVPVATKSTPTLSPPTTPSNNRLRSISNVSTSSTLASVDSASSSASVVAFKRQRDFESLFGPQLRPRRLGDRPPDFLTVLQTQSGDLQSSVLLHGRLYLTSYHLCFRSNIVGYVTEKIHPLTELVKVERSTTAKWIQNAVSITVVKENGEEEVVGYGSMKDREAMYLELMEVWKIRAPERFATFMKTTKEEAAQHAIEERTSTSTIRPTLEKSDSASSSSVATVDGGAEEAKKPAGGRERAASEVRHTKPSGEKYDHVALDSKIPIPMDQLFDLLYHNKEFHMDFLENKQKLTDINVGEWEEADGKKERKMTYVMHMNNRIGPKKSDCNGLERMEKVDPDKAYEIVSETQTPDIPSGKSFKIRTRTCLSHTGLDNNETPATRLYCTTQCDWSASSMLKGTITPAVIKGQKDYHQQLLSAIKAWVKAHPEDFAVRPVSTGGAVAVGENGEKADTIAGSVNGDDEEDEAGRVGVMEEKGTLEYVGDIPGNPAMLWIVGLLGLSLALNWYLFARRC